MPENHITPFLLKKT